MLFCIKQAVKLKVDHVTHLSRTDARTKTRSPWTLDPCSWQSGGAERVPNETIVCLLQIYEYLRHQLNYLFKKNSCDSTGFSILTEFSRLNFTQCNVNHAQQVVNLYEIFILPEEELCEPFRNSLSLIWSLVNIVKFVLDADL